MVPTRICCRVAIQQGPHRDDSLRRLVWARQYRQGRVGDGLPRAPRICPFRQATYFPSHLQVCIDALTCQYMMHRAQNSRDSVDCGTCTDDCTARLPDIDTDEFGREEENSEGNGGSLYPNAGADLDQPQVRRRCVLPRKGNGRSCRPTATSQSW